MKFLEQIAQQLLQKHGCDLSRVLVLMPNQRSCTYLRNELQQQATVAVFAPDITTLQNAMLRLSSLTQAGPMELLADLYASYLEIGGTQPMDDFISIGQIMLNDFEELDLQLADPKSFFKNLELLQSMKTFGPGETPSEYKIKYRKFWEEFGQLYYTLRNKLLGKQQGYRGMILRQVAETEEQMQALENYQSVYLAGFSGLNKTDEAFIKYLLRERQAEMFWDADRYYVHDHLHEAGFFFRQYRQSFHIGEEAWKDAIRSRPKKITVIGAAKNIGQVKVAADILQHRLALDEHSALDTVVVVPDEKLLTPLMANLPANIASVNITMGVSMAGSQAAGWVEILFRLYENAQRFRTSSGNSRFYYKDVFTLLQHSFFRLLFSAPQAEAFIRKMKKYNRVVIGAAEIREGMGEEMNGLFFQGESVAEYAGFLSDHIRQLLDQLIQAVTQGRQALSPEVEITYRLLHILNTTRSIADLPQPISIGTFINLLREAIRQERVPLEGDPVKGLQVMGLQETRSLDFKNVIILSANEGILPSGKSMRTYIPYEIRKAFLSTYQERDAITAYLFYRLLHHAEQVFMLYNTEPDELGGGDKSRFILQLQHELSGGVVQLEEQIFAVDPPAATPEPDIVIAKNEPVMDKLRSLLTTSGLSPSALNTYINCSLQYYFRYIARIREQEDMEESMEAATIGSAIHYTLETIYRERLGLALDADFIQTQLHDKTRVEQLLRQYLKSRFDEQSLAQGRNLLLYNVCVQLTGQFLKHEHQYLLQLEQQGVVERIIGLEEELQYQLRVRDTEVLISGRTDRIEQVGEVVHIADYKTSNPETIPLLNDDTWQGLMLDPKYAKSVQLLMYAWLYYRSTGRSTIQLRSGIYWLRDANKHLDTLSVSKHSDIIQQEQLLQFEQQLTRQLAELLNEQIPFSKTDDEKRCMYCEFAKICGR